MRRPTHLLLSLLAVAALCCCACCPCRSKSTGGGAASASGEQADSRRFPDTLRVVTLYSPTSYFIYKDSKMGYDYDLVSRLAKDKKIALNLTVAQSLARAVEMLDSGKVDLIAYEVPVTAQYLQHVLPCGVENVTHQVLVQPGKQKSKILTDVTQLVGRDVYVEKDSKYYHRMLNLNRELGGGINVKPVERDTLITEDLIAMVKQGEIPLTVVDSDIAALNQTYYPDIDVSLTVGFPQRSAWAVARDRSWLADSINAWARQEAPKRQRNTLLKRYFEQSKKPEVKEKFDIDFTTGRMSPYDALFRRNAEKIDWDWRLLSAVGYVESHYDPSSVSWAGARGLMQLMPATARGLGLTMDNITDNEANVDAAVRLLKELDGSLRRHVKDPKERIKFILAAYNAGLGHVYDAISIARHQGLATDVWDGNVAEAMTLKSNPEIYNDPSICRHGYFRWRETYEYVRKVMACYEEAKRHIAL